MKRKIFSLILAVGMLMSSGVFAATVSFSDVAYNHWARVYINRANMVGIVNGYEDNTFKPERQVKTGEFLKMLMMAHAPSFKYEAPDPSEEDGTHWAKPYVMGFHLQILNAEDYNDEIMERVITREEAVALLTKAYIIKNSKKSDFKYKEDQSNVNNFTDQALITNKENRELIDNSISYGLINGFPDGSFKPNDGLTRAQAAKIIFSAFYE